MALPYAHELHSSSYSIGDDLAHRRKSRGPSACDFCRRKKIRCDRLHPCSSCRSRRVDCTYSSDASASRALGRTSDCSVGRLGPLDSVDPTFKPSGLAPLPGTKSCRRADLRPLGLGLPHLPDMPQRSGSWVTFEASLPPISPVPGLTLSSSSTPSTSSSVLSNPFGCGSESLNPFSPACTLQHRPLRRKTSCENLSAYGRIVGARQRSGSGVADDWSVSFISRKRSDIGLPWSSPSLSSSESRLGCSDDSFPPQPLSSSQNSRELFPSTESNPKFATLSSARLANPTPWSSGPLAQCTRDLLAMPSGFGDSLPRLSLPLRAPSARLSHAVSYAYGMSSSIGEERSVNSRKNEFGDPFSKYKLGSYDQLGGLPLLPSLGMPNIGSERRPLAKNASLGSLSRYEGSGW